MEQKMGRKQSKKPTRPEQAVALIEPLELRIFLDAVQTFWNDQGNHMFSDPANWTNGVPWDDHDTFEAVFLGGGQVKLDTNCRTHQTTAVTVINGELTWDCDGVSYGIADQLTVSSSGGSASLILKNSDAATSVNLTVGTATVGLGESSIGSLTVTGGAMELDVNTRLTLADSPLAQGSLNVEDTGKVVVASQLLVGNRGWGTLNVRSGGKISSPLGYLSVGLNSGSGEVNVDSGGNIACQDFFASGPVLNPAQVLVDGQDSKLSSTGVLHLGNNGGGATLIVRGRGKVESGRAEVYRQGPEVDAQVADGGTWVNSGSMQISGDWDGGLVTVTGQGSSLTTGSLSLGGVGRGVLRVNQLGSAIVKSGGVRIGRNVASVESLVEVSDAGTMKVEGGGVMIAENEDSQGKLLVINGSTFDASSTYMLVGQLGQGSLDVWSESSVVAQYSIIGDDSKGTGVVNVNGNNSVWENQYIYVGNFGNGRVIIENGGLAKVTSPETASIIGYGTGGNGNVTITGQSSKWESSGRLVVGGRDGEFGELTISDNALVTSVTGTVSEGIAKAKLTIDAAQWNVTSDHRMDVGFDANLDHTEVVVKTGGKLTATGGIKVGKSTRLTGNAILKAILSSSTGARVLPGIGGTDMESLTFEGDFNSTAGVELEIQVGDSGMNDLLAVTGTADLGGNVFATSLIDSTTYAAGDSFDILTASHITGAFANLAAGVHIGGANLPVLSGGLAWRVEYGQNDSDAEEEVTLMVVAPYQVQIDPLQHGIASDNNIGTGSLSWTNVYAVDELDAVYRALLDSQVVLSAARSNGSNYETYGAGGGSGQRLSLRDPANTGHVVAGSEQSLAEAFGSAAGDWAIAYEDGGDWDYNDSYFPVWVSGGWSTHGGTWRGGNLDVGSGGEVSLGSASGNEGNITASDGGIVTMENGADNNGSISIADGGTLNQSGTASNSGTIEVRNGGVMNLTGWLDNNETLTLSGGAINLSNNATLRNYGTIDITADGAMTTGTGSGRLFNHDTIRKSGGEGTFVVPASVYIENRAGGFDVQSGTVEVGFWLHVTANDSFIKYGSGTLDLADGLTVSGTATMEAGTLVVGADPYTLLNVAAGGEFTLSGGTLESNWTSVSGTFLQTGGIHDANGSFTTINVIGNDAIYRIEGGEFYADNLSIGIGGEGGRMEQAGGVVSAINLALVDGRWGNVSSEAVYAMSAGTLNISGTIWVGGATAGSGLFEQWGGEVSAGSVLIGMYGAAGTWVMHDGLLATGVLTVDAVNGAFLQEGGTVVVG